jgi:hypothetical protein
MSEDTCNFIGSAGFRKSCTFHGKHENEYYGNYINFNNIKNNDTVYIKSDYLKDFYININNLNNKIILLSGCSDYTIPNDIFTDVEFTELLNNPNIICCYFQNCVYKHNKIINLPIGLDYHTMTTNYIYWGSIKSPLEQENELIDIINIAKPFYERQIKIYSNCHFFISNKKFTYDRIDALNKISQDLLYLEPTIIDRRTSWATQVNYCFVLSPHGNGLDCHRTWEALILGCIPIVKKSPIDDLYIDLPVLIVNDWVEVNKDLLINTIEKFKKINFNYEKLELKYWINKIKNNLF